MKTLTFSEKAHAVLLQILQYIARDKPQAGIRFVDKVEEQCRFLAGCPQAGTRRDDLAPLLRLYSFRG